MNCSFPTKNFTNAQNVYKLIVFCADVCKLTIRLLLRGCNPPVNVQFMRPALQGLVPITGPIYLSNQNVSQNFNQQSIGKI